MPVHPIPKHHSLSPLSTYLKEIVYGGNDGIITTFAVVAGFTGSQQENILILPVFTVILFGFANLFSDAFSMAMGNFLSTQSERDLYAHEKEVERLEIQQKPEEEEWETIEILKQKGFSTEQSKTLTEIYKTNESYWLSFMMNNELQLPNPENEHPLLMSLSTFFAFCGFGLIPLLPYVFAKDSPLVFVYSIIATITALVVIGILRFIVTKQHWIRSIGETLLLGTTAAVVAYIVGRMIGS